MGTLSNNSVALAFEKKRAKRSIDERRARLWGRGEGGIRGCWEAVQEDELLAGLIKKVPKKACAVPLRSGAALSLAPSACAVQEQPKAVARHVEFLEVSNKDALKLENAIIV